MFGNDPVGNTSAPMTLTLTNNTNRNITISSVSVSVNQFSYSGLSLPKTLASGQGFTVSVTFKPSAAQTYSGTMVFTRANGSTITVSLSGAGTQTSQPPAITKQPSSQTITAGQTATFSVAATGTMPIAYQWKKNGLAITGASSSSFITPPQTTADSNSQFSVTVANPVGNANSNAAMLTVMTAAVAPTITTQPAGKTIVAGQTATFTVAATGTSPMTYQWNKNSTTISGATSSSYTTPAETTADNNAKYTVTVTNSAGNATSNPAILTVSAAAVAPTPTVGVVSPNSGSTSGGAAAKITGTNFAAGAKVTFGGAAATNVVVVNSTTITATTPAGSAGAVTVTVTVSGQSGSLASGFTYAVSTCAQNLAIGSFTLCGEIYNDVSAGANVTVNYSPSPNNGIIVWATWCFNSSCNTSISGVTATIGDNINATESCFVASPHSPFITNSNGGGQSSGDFQQHYVWYCPSIPAGVTSFTVTPSNPSVSYLQLNITEWKSGSLAASCSPISACFENVDNLGEAGNATGGTTATISTSDSTVNANDLIFSVTEVPCCSFTASPGTGYTGITVAPSVTPGMVSEAKATTATGIQTATTTWTGGNAAWFGVIVPIVGAGVGPVVPTVSSVSPNSGTTAGRTPVTITGTNFAASATVTFGAVAATSVVVVNSTTITATTPAGSAGAVAVTVTVGAQSGSLPSGFTYKVITATTPTITTQPASQSVIAGQTATFSVAATGTSPMTYQWKKNGTAINGGTSSTYTTPSETTADNNAQLSVTVINSAGSATSSSATLTVNAATLVLNSSSSALSFGSINVSSSSSQSVTLTNAGNSNVAISSVTVSGAGFNASGIPTGLILNPGQTTTLTATFSPFAAGSVIGSVLVASNASNSPDAIALSGTGVAVVNHSATLSWTASISAVIGYNTYSSKTSGGPYTKLTSTPNAGTSYTDSTVQAGATYYYVVTSVNSSGMESVYSNETSATIP
jgi:IPT/TIG domain/Abnormal spindle-like microcephaly-assoc'd, ASPM-SPD-2-Hydin/Immunoglobulin I-set domain